MFDPGMPCTCPGCDVVVDLNDMVRDPLDPTRVGLVCPSCATERRQEADPAAAYMPGGEG
jgi:hypothetical protein